MPDIKAGDKFKWTGPDQRTREVCEQTVWAAYDADADGDQVYVHDDVGYLIPVSKSELKPAKVANA